MAAPTQKYSCVGGMVKKPSTGLSYYFGKAGPSGFGSASTAEQVAASWNGEGKTVIITGALPSHPIISLRLMLLNLLI